MSAKPFLLLPLLAFVLAGGAHAQAPAAPAEHPAPAPATLFGSEAAKVEPAQLDAVTGRADLSMVIDARNSSEVSHNSVSGESVTGTISFDSSAFQNLNGLSVLSANTGNNVAINASLNVNVAVRQ